MITVAHEDCAHCSSAAAALRALGGQHYGFDHAGLEHWAARGACWAQNGRCGEHGGRWGASAAGMCQTEAVLADVASERAAQVARYGDNYEVPDGSGPAVKWLEPFSNAGAAAVEQLFRYDYEAHSAPTWVRLLREELAEAAKESDPVRLRAEVLQVAALAVSWVEKIDARENL